MAALEVSGGSLSPLDPGTPGGPTPAAAAMDRHLSGVGLYPTAGRELHPRGHPVGRRCPGEGPAQIGTLGTYSVDSGPQPSPNVNDAIPFALYRLSATAAGQAEAQGRYAVLSEKQDSDLKTSIIDSLTGDTYAYQKGPSGPNGTMPVARHWSPTQAQFNDMPTDPAALRRLLIAQYDEQFNQSAAAITSLRKRHIPGGDQDGESDAGKVFQQASGMLWNPLVGPQLRAALFRVLATLSPSW